MKVYNMTSKNTGREIANQFIIEDGKGNTLFQSYQTTIAMIDNRRNIILDYEAENYSRTTSKYLYRFLYENGFSIHDKKSLLQAEKEGRIIRAMLSEL